MPDNHQSHFWSSLCNATALNHVLLQPQDHLPWSPSSTQVHDTTNRTPGQWQYTRRSLPTAAVPMTPTCGSQTTTVLVTPTCGSHIQHINETNSQSMIKLCTIFTNWTDHSSHCTEPYDQYQSYHSPYQRLMGASNETQESQRTKKPMPYH